MSLESMLTNKVQKALTKNGCQILKWTRMGRDINALRLKQFKLLNMKAILGMNPTEAQVYIMDCYFSLHLIKP